MTTFIEQSTRVLAERRFYSEHGTKDITETVRAHTYLLMDILNKYRGRLIQEPTVRVIADPDPTAKHGTVLVSATVTVRPE